jgi:hypothetical protein
MAILAASMTMTWSRISSAAPQFLEQEELARQSRALESVANEAALFIGELEQAKLTNAYIRIHLKKLQEELEDARQKLNKPLPPELADRGGRVHAAAEALSILLRDLRISFSDPKAVAQARRSAKRLGEELRHIESTS